MIVAHLRGNAIAYLALVVALSTGSAYAADQLANGSVTKAKLAKNAVTSPKIKKNAVKSSDVKDGGLTAADLASGVLPTALTFKSESDGATPAAVPDAPGIRTIAFTSGGLTYLQLSFSRAGLDCSAGTGTMGLYVDGQPVPGTRYTTASFANARPVLLGGTLTVTPGNHTATFAMDCPSGDFTASFHSDGTWFVLGVKS